MIIHDVEQGTEEWHALRAGKPTASEFSKLVTSKGEPSKSMPEYAIQLAADAYAGEPLDRWQGNEWSERGHEMEDRARAYYELEHPDRTVTQVGFITDDDETIGASPDSLVDINEDSANQHPDPLRGFPGDGLLEIKCLKATRHIKALMYFDKNGSQPADYVQQPQGQIMIAERKWCDLLFWHPELPALTVRCVAIDKIQVNLRLQIGSCIDERDRVLNMLKNR